MDVGIVVDSSSSVRRDNFEKVKQFLVNLVGKLHVSHSNAHVGVIHYNHRPFLDWDFKADVAQNPIKLKAGILALRYRPGGTRTDRAMDLADEAIFRVAHGERLNVPHIMLVVTDGKTNPGSKAYQDVVKPFEVTKSSSSFGKKAVSISIFIYTRLKNSSRQYNKKLQDKLSIWKCINI